MFEFDPKKSKANKEKHKIDFVEAQELWSVPSIILNSLYAEEGRMLLIAELRNKCWTAIFTNRFDNVRIISVRRSRKKEEELFYEKE